MKILFARIFKNSSEYPRVSRGSSIISLQKSMAGMLIFVLLFSQTFQFSWFHTAEAQSQNYTDIVSIVVDEETNKNLSSEINQYARDIQNFLGSTEVNILVTKPNTTPAMIAAHNEKLYYEGSDTKKQKSRLVGTILIGNIPIPMVGVDGQFFPSVFPYVDFDNKTFVFNDRSGRYEKTALMSGGSEAVEIWHGVINPSVGRDWNASVDISQIRDFLNKTHDFYQKKGVFAKEDNNHPPKVFYFDGFNESKSLSARAMKQYDLRIQNAENIAYNRFTKNFLKEINEQMATFDKTENADEKKLLGDFGMNPNILGSENFEDKDIATTPDIQTASITNKLLVNFHEIFNKKVLGEELLAVHNAGRYNHKGKVRADTTSIQMSVMDKVAMDTIKGINERIRENFLKDFQSKKYFRKIAIADRVIAGYGNTARLPYRNYFFGTPSEQIKNPNQCTIARGNSEGKTGVLVEANVAFDVSLAQSHLDKLMEGNHKWGEDYCFPGDDSNKIPQTYTFWGGNSILRPELKRDSENNSESNSAGNPLMKFPDQTIFSGFTQPIFSTGGMLASNRIQNPSIAQCENYTYQYTLKEPYKTKNLNPSFLSDLIKSRGKEIKGYVTYPKDASSNYLEFTCRSEVDVIDEKRTIFDNIDTEQSHLLWWRDEHPNEGIGGEVRIRPESIFAEAKKYMEGQNCIEGNLVIDGKIAFKARANGLTCSSPLGLLGETHDVSKINYRDISFHTIPGFAVYTSPTPDEIAAAQRNGATSSLPVNHDHYIEFYTKKGNLAKLVFPNFFRDPIDIERLKNTSKKDWDAIIQKEQATIQNPVDASLAVTYLGATDLPNEFDWSNYISEDDLKLLEEAKNWIQLGQTIDDRHRFATKNMLSRSGNELANILPTAGSKYEIAYLGLKNLTLDNSSDQKNSELDRDNAEKLSILRAFNMTEKSDNSTKDDMNVGSSNSHSDNNSLGVCNDSPDGVPLAKWPGAIRCWVKKQFPPKILAGTCGADTIGLHSHKKPVLNISNAPLSEQKKAIETAKILPHFSRKHFAHNESGSISVTLQNDDNNLSINDGAKARVKIISMTSDGKNVDSTEYEKYIKWSPQELSFAGESSYFSFQTFGKNVRSKAQIIYTITAADGQKIEKASEEFEITVSEEFLDVQLENAKGEGISAIHSDTIAPSFVSILKKKNLADDGKNISDYTIKILDDISGQVVVDNIPVGTEKYRIPVDITSNIGSYRVIVRDASGVEGEATFAVKGGKFVNVQLQPTSSVMVANATNIVNLLLKDGRGNAVSPDLHSVKFTITGGKILDREGKEHSEMQFDIFDSFASIEIRSEKSKKITLTAIIDEGTKEVQKVQTEITVLPSARIAVMPTTQPTIGGNPVSVRIEIKDSQGEILKGFNGVATISLPEIAGVFDRQVLKITNGISEIFNYIPGTVAGKYAISLAIPGIGIFKDSAPIVINPGKAMYVDTNKNEQGLIFSVRDRYGNLTNFSGKGYLSYNNREPQEIDIKDGTVRVNRPPVGSYIFEVPDISKNTLEYTENGEKKIILPVSKVTAWMDEENKTFSFADDYNARYTVLAGGSFLREAEQILYGSPDKDTKKYARSESLAATTLLESPYANNSLFSVFANGGYSVGKFGDAIVDTVFGIERGYPKISVLEGVQKVPIAEVLYRLNNAQFVVCENDCKSSIDSDAIIAKTLVNNSARFETRGQNLILTYNDSIIATIDKDGKITADSSVQIQEKKDEISSELQMQISFQGQEIAEISYRFSINNSVKKITDTQGDIFSVQDSGPILRTMGYVAFPISDVSLSNFGSGYALKNVLSYNTGFDAIKVGPTDIEDLATLAEKPGVGWGENNRMMLSFAAGDTVGQATKWFHTYMMINLGDPVLSVEHGLPGTQQDGLDRTLGIQIADSRRANIVNHFQKDMNADGLDDILVQYVDGYIELILNLGGRFRSTGNVAYIPKLSDGSRLEIGDFMGDKYSDLVAINASGNFVFVNNTQRRLADKDMTVVDGELPGAVQQMKVRDMDADGRDDIVYLTNYGELGILYGTEVAGKFSKKILDSSLGMALKEETSSHGGAITHAGMTSQLLSPVTVNPNNSDEADISDASIRSLVYFADANIESEENSTAILDGNTDLSIIGRTSSGDNFSNFIDDTQTDAPNPENTSSNSLQSTLPVNARIFARSQYAPLVGADIQKTFSAPKNAILKPGATIQAKITITNTSNSILKAVEYQDTIPKMFARDGSKNYSIDVAGTNTEKPFSEISGEYNLAFAIGDIPVGAKATITYTLNVLPISYGEMLVGDFENAQDPYGDVAFNASNTCGAAMTQWLSVDKREYRKMDRSPIGNVTPLPKGIEEKISDADRNGVPDHIDHLMNTVSGTGVTANALRNQLKDSAIEDPISQKSLFEFKKKGAGEYSFDINEEVAQNVENMAENIANGLSCGFGGGSCMSFPINWAPLAPGNDPVVMGTPVGDGFKVNEGIPVFSAMTTMPTTFGPIPAIWPPFPNGAGGYLPKGTYNSFLRIFATPTLTMGMGGAVCLGPTSAGRLPPKGLSPLVKGGNCIVMAKPMNVCSGDGSVDDGDIRSLAGLGDSTAARTGGLQSTNVNTINEVWNGRSCNISLTPTVTLKNEQKDLEKTVLSYMQTAKSSGSVNSEKRKEILGISAKISRGNISSLNSGPLIQIGSQTHGASEFDFSITGDNNIANIRAVVDTKNRRIAAFPDFIMDWLTRQTEEITTSLFTPPNLTIIPPTNFGQNAKVDSSYGEFLEKLQSAYSTESINALKQQMGDAYSANNSAAAVKDRVASGGSSQLANRYQNTVGKSVDNMAGAINSVGGGLDAIRAAYSFIGKLPFVTLRENKVNINVPWILPSELDQYERKLKEYRREIDRAATNWCINASDKAACLKEKGTLNASALKSSIDANLRRIDEYRHFPEKLQKYVTWKQKLLYDLLCNIEMVEKNIFGWIKDNGVRFQKWVELYVLIKAIAESWQPLLDIFAKANAECGVCRNERHNSQKWKFKLISAIIPKIPVIRFPKWPDIILDLSDVRFGMLISVPDFNFRISPIRLPRLPNFSLPNAPTGSLTLPSIPVLPALPELPDLPKLPSLPQVKLPDLPPPPKLPKLGGKIKATTNILKLIAKMYCYYQKTMLIPEWQVGDVIAQRTERQGTLPMDFLDVQLPQFSLPSLREIRVNTHLHYELRSDFLTEMAKNAVKPINRFSTDLQKKVPAKIGNDVNVKSPLPQRVDIDMTNQETMKRSLQNLQSRSPHGLFQSIIDEFENEKHIALENNAFKEFFENELREIGEHKRAEALNAAFVAAGRESQKLQKEIMDYQIKRSHLIRDFIEEQNKNTAEMQNVIDLLQNRDEAILAKNFENVGEWASDASDTNSPALTALQKLDQSAFEKPKRGVIMRDISLAKNQLHRKMHLLAQAHGTHNTDSDRSDNPPSLQNNHAGAQYAPKFDGMYVLTEITKTQTKLFDYTELIRKKDRVDVIDLDRDGDRDFVYLLGDILYVKSTHIKNPGKYINTTIKTETFSEKLPEVPNAFNQIHSTPSELNISFQNTVPNETEWRMEFFDKYIEWDVLDISGKHSALKTTVDMFLETEFSEYNQNGLRSKKIARALKSKKPNENFTLRGPQIRIIPSDNRAMLSPNRIFITGKDGANIDYQKEGQSPQRMELSPYTAYQFDAQTEITANKDIFVVISTIGDYVYKSNEIFDGMPLLPGMNIASDEPYSIWDETHQKNIEFSKNQDYITLPLAKNSGEYNFNIAYPNGYYYGRLQHLSQGKNNRAGVVLISPNAASDSTGPVTSLSDNIRVPVFAQVKIPLKEHITELSRYTVFIDNNNAIDSDKNGVYDDDFESKTIDAAIDNHQTLVLGGFDTPGNRNMTLLIRDEYGNETKMPIVVEVYTPIPTIESGDTKTKTLTGSIHENIEGEPIDIFRVRTGELPKKITNQSVITDKNGTFSAKFSQNDEVITVRSQTSSWQVLPTGIFKNLPNGFSVKVIPSSRQNPLHIAVFNDKNTKVYSQFMSLPNDAKIILNSENTDQKTGLFVTPSVGYSLQKTGISHQFLPNGAYVVDDKYQPILAIARDGNIYAVDSQSDVQFSLSERDNYLVIIAKKGEKTIAEFQYKLNFFFTAK